ncbi:probable LRR receptor-like serine/threonine-protein kinase At1g56140 [Hibiscus syriacus]|uniref:probable LRR receptor-like serine/threonine-protein kinase At1g56140 n=1 Tax=Hibiscus syriacus TaxID=106335 RepID=UPI001921109B|nr:probable LRR receptor-like serine/threonine-protein kinase At1g56140 [Hibiscus syriacus]
MVHDILKQLEELFKCEQRGSLNWMQRCDIILGTVRGLSYLHVEFHVCIIHRDIKSSNTLLDDDFQPKIADFWLARLLPKDKSHLSTKFAGTFCQRSHETTSDSDACLLKKAWTLYENKMQHRLVEESLDRNEYEEEEAKRMVENRVDVHTISSGVEAKHFPSGSVAEEQRVNGKQTTHKAYHH